MARKILKEHPTPWICRISRLATLFVGREMGRIGFGLGQFHFLSEIYGEEGLSQDELSSRVGVDKSNTSRALAKLEKYGLIYRKANPVNHKVKEVYLQQKALEIEKDFRKIQQRCNANLLRGFSEQEINMLLSSLKKMAQNAEAALCEDNGQGQSWRQAS
jgi:DNA-binding MarR family transcriptional regulator